MYIERDAKIILIYGSIKGIIWFAALFIFMAMIQSAHPNDNFNIIQIMTFGIISALALILIGSSYSLKKEISTQQKYIKEHGKAKNISEEYVKIPYNKSGLYSLIIGSLIGVIVFLYLYGIFIIQPAQEYKNQNIGVVSMMIFVFLVIFIIILVVSFFSLTKKIRTPLYYNFKACPRCSSNDINKVEYSWWGGLIGPVLVHQVRCKKCGMTYDGATGTNITKRVGRYIAIVIIIITILQLLRFIL